MAIDRRKHMFTVAEVAEIAGVSLSAVYKAWQLQKFPSSSKIGSVHIINRYDLEAWIESRTKEEVE